MRVLIVDDEPVARLGIRRALAGQTSVEIIGECATGRQALRMLREFTPDLVYLDVQLPGLDGFDVLEQLGAPDNPPVVIFVTAFEQYALDAFGVQAVDYLVKPWRRERFQQALERARLWLAARSDPRCAADEMRLTVRSPQGIRTVAVTDIDWIEAADNYVSLHTRHGVHLLRATIEGMESRLSRHGFLRIHRSRLVNLQRVEHLRPLRHGEFEIVLQGGQNVRSGRAYREEIHNYWEL
jgi:two-component system, LytTR family, response regulator